MSAHSIKFSFKTNIKPKLKFRSTCDRPLHMPQNKCIYICINNCFVNNADASLALYELITNIEIQLFKKLQIQTIERVSS